jgi:hypothetical protein
MFAPFPELHNQLTRFLTAHRGFPSRGLNGAATIPFVRQSGVAAGVYSGHA